LCFINVDENIGLTRANGRPTHFDPFSVNLGANSGNPGLGASGKLIHKQ
jgi:hypothetical protein